MKKLTLALSLFVGVWLAPLCAPGKDNSGLDLARQLNQAFAEVAEKVSPSVVVLTVHQKLGAGLDAEGNGLLDSLIPELRRELERRQLEIPAQGSGVIIREDGYILTNGHVVEDADKIEVRLHDGRTFPAKVRGVDLKSDVAVIKIEATGLPKAVLADSTKTRVGEFAIAIGAPFSLDYTVTFGHVSAKGRSDVLQEMGSGLIDQEFIQTDALINPGNSGGPLVNIDGEVIGINTLIRGMHTGIGFAIPSSLAREVSDQLVTDGKFTRAMLGVASKPFREVPEALEWVKDLKAGLIVTMIVPDGPAAKSDLATNDIITAVDGKQVATVQQLRGEIRGKKLGQPVTLDILRQDSGGNSKRINVEIKPAEWADVDVSPPRVIPQPPRAPPVEAAEPPAIGVTVHTLSHAVAAQYGLDVTSDGVVVVAVEKGTPAARKGIKPGDIITTVNKQPVSSLKDYQDALRQADLKKGVTIRVLSGRKSRLEILKEGE